ncbi:MAG: hypothetical protein HYZ28_08435 [Myxococcales bacterium]|nr:hypothetical protein [Myxococcales bacterium]
MRIKDREIVKRHLAPNPAVGDLPSDIYDLVAGTGALLEDHFELQSGDHSPLFLRFSQIGWNRDATSRVAEVLVESTRFDWRQCRLLCSDSAGLFLGNAVALRTGRPLAITKVDARRRPLQTMREGTIESGEPVVIVNDVVTRGETLRRLMELVEVKQAQLRGILAFAAVRPGLFTDLLREKKVPATWLLEATWKVWPVSECPLCAAKKPLLPAIEFA